MSQDIITITDSSFEPDVMQSTKPVLVDFWAPWCGPCRALTPILEELAQEKLDKLTVAKLNIDENPQTPSEYGVMSIPTMMVFKNGQLVATKVGLASKSELAAFVDSHM